MGYQEQRKGWTHWRKQLKSTGIRISGIAPGLNTTRKQLKWWEIGMLWIAQGLNKLSTSIYLELIIYINTHEFDRKMYLIGIAQGYVYIYICLDVKFNCNQWCSHLQMLLWFLPIWLLITCFFNLSTAWEK